MSNSTASGPPPFMGPLPPQNFYIPGPAVPAVINDLIFTSLAVIVVTLRLITRICVVKNVGLDDYLIGGAALASVGFLTTVMLQIKYGLGRQVSFPELPNFLEALWATIPVYNLALILCKLSIAVQCYRVFRTPNIQRMLKGLIAFLIIYGLWAILGSIFTCVPVALYWSATLGMQGHCIDRNALTYANAGINIVSDIVLIAIPLPLLRNLQIPKKQKIILFAVFACGSVACVMSIIRLKSLYDIGSAPPSQQSIDGVAIAIWSCIEINVAIICASIPALKAMVVKVFPKFLLSDLYARSRGNYASRSGNHRLGALGGNNTGARFGGTTIIKANLSQNTTTSAESSSKKPSKQDIVVHKSIEMTVEDDLHRGPNSRDGSENNLVTNGWRADAYASSQRKSEYGHGYGHGGHGDPGHMV